MNKRISFTHEPKGVFINHLCFNCGLMIDYSFCDVYLDDEFEGSLCIRCVYKLEKEPEKYLKNYKNLPSVEKFYKAALTLSAKMENIEDIESYILEYLPKCYEEDAQHILIVDKTLPLKENNGTLEI